jgi:organic anion transporter 4A
VLLNFTFHASVGYDIASFFCLIPVSYYGGRAGASKLKWVGYGICIMGLGFFVFSLPHFLVGPYRAQTPTNNVCGIAGNDTTFDCSENSKSAVEDLSWNVWFFFIAQLLHGLGIVSIKEEEGEALDPYLTAISLSYYHRP